MKKIIFSSLIIFSFVFLGAGSALATSGACSGHGGVNCSAGASYNGNVICNDGWTGSSVSYDSMTECVATSYVRCTQDEYNSLLQKYGVNDKANQLSSITTKVTSISQQLQSILQQMQTLAPKMDLYKIEQDIATEGGGGLIDRDQAQAEAENEYDAYKSQYYQLSLQEADLNNQNSSLKEQGDALLTDLDSLTAQVNEECHQMALDNQNQQVVPSVIYTIPQPTPSGSPSLHSTLHTTNYPQINNATSSVTASTSTPTSTPKQFTSPKIKHWLDWLNPFNWFKK